MTRRFWITWAIALPVMIGFYLLYWNRAQDPSPVESDYVRTGIVVLLTGIPIGIAAFRLPRLHHDSLAWWVIPVLLGLFVLAVGLGAGFVPDHPTDCAYLQRFHQFDPTCTTTSTVRTRVFVEMVGVWLGFGGLAAIVAGWRRRRSERARLAQSSAP